MSQVTSIGLPPSRATAARFWALGRSQYRSDIPNSWIRVGLEEPMLVALAALMSTSGAVDSVVEASTA